MAITKIHAIKTTPGRAIDYIENPQKTDGQMLISGYNCDPQTAAFEFQCTATLAKQGRKRKRHHTENLAYHLIQSFSPDDDLTPEQAHAIGQKLAMEFSEGRHEYVIATHIDKGHLHNHIIFNATSFYDQKKMRTVPYRTARQLRGISDRLCAEAELAIIETPESVGHSYSEYIKKRKPRPVRTEIRRRLNFCLKHTADYEQFKLAALALGVRVDDSGKYVTYFYSGSQKGIRETSLADTDKYSISGIREQLEDNLEDERYEPISPEEMLAAFAAKVRTKPENPDTLVKLSGSQILKASENGFLLAVCDRAGVPANLMLDRQHIEADPVGGVQIALGSQFEYDIVYADGKHTTIRGGDLVKQIELHNQVKPKRIQLDVSQIKTMSLKGVTVTLPDQGIERLFIPDEFVHRDKLAGTCTVDVYDNWDYSYVPTGEGEKKIRQITKGAALAKALQTAVQTVGGGTSLRERINYVERKSQIQNAQYLARTLQRMKHSGLHTAKDYLPHILSVRTEQRNLRAKIAEEDKKAKQYALTAKYLQVCCQYGELAQQYEEKPKWVRKMFDMKNQDKLEAYRAARKALERLGISEETEISKVLTLARATEDRKAELQQQLNCLVLQEQEIIREQQSVDEIQSEQERDYE